LIAWRLIEVMVLSVNRALNPVMPKYVVTIVNEHFSQTGEQEAADPVSVWKKAISSAIAIAADQIRLGPVTGSTVIRLVTSGGETKAVQALFGVSF